MNGSGGADYLIGNDVFVFQVGQANGDLLAAFACNGAGLGDGLVFSGYGLGAGFNNVGGSAWSIDYNSGASHETITFEYSATIDPSDYVFV